MPSQADVQLAAQLVFRGLVDRDAIEQCLGAANGAGSLAEAVVERGLLDREAMAALQLEIAISDGALPEIFPGYTIQRKLGEGGMSWVFMARRAATDGPVAIKVLRPGCAAEARTRAQFVREAKLLKGLRHENLVEGYEVGKIRGYYFFSMEAIDGDTLLSYIDDEMVFDEDAALYVVLQIARVLEDLRENGIVHRDIKPGNILLTRENTVKLCDLGLASVEGEQGGAADDAAEGNTVGTVQYVSPEQARGTADLDVRSDIYSLGVTLYHLVLGKLPFEGEDGAEIMAKQILESLSAPEVKGRLSPHMHYFIEKMMAKDREIRYQEPLELIRDIETQIEGKKTLTFNPMGDRPVERAGTGSGSPQESAPQSAPTQQAPLRRTGRASRLRRGKRR